VAAGRVKSSAPLAYHSVWIITFILLVIGLCMMLSVSLATTIAALGGQPSLSQAAGDDGCPGYRLAAHHLPA